MTVVDAPAAERDVASPSVIDERRRCRVVGAVAVLVVAIPFALMVVVHQGRRWYPIMDQALIELLVRDVGTADSPTTGLVGRFDVDGLQAAHPGPLSWFMMWPIHRLAGASSSALLMASVAIHLTAVVTLVWIVARRRRLGLLLLVTVAVAVVARGYGIIVISEVWNPHLPVLWWLVYVFAAWSVLCGDRALVLVMAFAGSLCVQTHVSYFGPVVALSVLVLAAMTLEAIRKPASRRREVTWIAAGAATTALLWVPPVYDQWFHDHGNLGLLWQYFTNGEHPMVGWQAGAETLLVHLNPWRLVTGEFWGDRQSDVAGLPSGSIVPGVLVLGSWLVCAALATRSRDRPLLMFHAVTAVVVGSAIVAASRIIPPVWYWVVMWMWGVAIIVLIAIAWTLATVARGFADDSAVWRLRSIERVAVLAGLTVVTLVFIAETVIGPRVDEHVSSQRLGRLLGPTVAALQEGTRPDGRYRVTWSDPATFGIQGWGLINELERRGFDVGAAAWASPQVRPHRVVEDDATAVLELAGGVHVDLLRGRPGAIELAYDDPRSAAERAAYTQVRAELMAALESADQRHLIPLVDENIAALVFGGELTPAARQLAERLTEIGIPMAVFLVPLDR